MNIDTGLLLSSIKSAPASKMPEMNADELYIWENIYTPLLHGRKVFLSSLDFDAMDEDGLRSFNELHENVFEMNIHNTSHISWKLGMITPKHRATEYV